MRGRAAHRLRGDRGGPGRGGDSRRGLSLSGDRPLQARDLRGRGPAHVRGKPARDQGGGPGLRRAHLPVRGRGHLDDHRRADPGSAGKPAAVPARAARHLRFRLWLGRADYRRDDLHPAARVRQRRRVADRNRGGLGRRRRIPAAGGHQRPPRAHGRGRDPGHPRGRHLVAGARHPRHAVQERLSDRAGPGGQARLRAHDHRAGPVLRGAGRDHADPVHRREHQLQRLPVPDQLRGRRLVPAPVAAQARDTGWCSPTPSSC